MHEGYLHAPKKEDAAKHDSLTQLESQIENLRDRKCKDHRIRQDISHGVRDPESSRVDTCCEDGLIPRTGNRDTLQYRRSDCGNVPAHDDGRAGPAGILEGVADEYALAKQVCRHFVQTNDNFVWCLSDEEPFEGGRELWFCQVGFVHAVAVRYGELYRD